MTIGLLLLGVVIIIIAWLSWCRADPGPTDVFDDDFLDIIHEYDYGDKE